MTPRPIANKYSDGKMKRTLKRGLKVFEIAGREVFKTINNKNFLLFRVVCIRNIKIILMIFEKAAFIELVDHRKLIKCQIYVCVLSMKVVLICYHFS
jgi:hypothetical protein